MTNKGSEALLAEIRKTHQWLQHETLLPCLEGTNGIWKQGLRRGSPGGARSIANVPVDTSLVFLGPLGATMNLRARVDDPPIAILAVNQADLPSAVGLDASFPQFVGELERAIASAETESKALTATVRVMSARGTFAFAEPIRPEHIRIRIRSSEPTDPTDWPPLTELSSLDGIFLNPEIGDLSAGGIYP